MNLTSHGIGSALLPNSPEGHAVRALIIATLALAAVISLTVGGLVTYAIVRYRDRGDGVEPRQTGGNRKVEIAYTVIPLCIQICLFIFTVITMNRAEPQEPNRSPDLIIIAHQWWWELRYPQADVVTANEIHLPAGRAIWTELESADVIHEVWVPQLGPKKDTVPGKPNFLLLQADEPGIYLGDCAEYCGAGHAWMRLRVIVQSPADFARWERQQAKSEIIADPNDPGRRVFLNKTCVQCHQVKGLPVSGNVGPDLTHFGSRQTLGSGVLDNTPATLAQWLSNPQAVKPGCYMPNMRLTSSEIHDLTAYLEGLK